MSETLAALIRMAVFDTMGMRTCCTHFVWEETKGYGFSLRHKDVSLKCLILQLPQLHLSTFKFSPDEKLYHTAQADSVCD